MESRFGIVNKFKLEIQQFIMRNAGIIFTHSNKMNECNYTSS